MRRELAAVAFLEVFCPMHVHSNHCCSGLVGTQPDTYVWGTKSGVKRLLRVILLFSCRSQMRYDAMMR